MADSTSRHTIKYTVDIDDSDVMRKAEATQQRINEKLRNQGRMGPVPEMFAETGYRAPQEEGQQGSTLTPQQQALEGLKGKVTGEAMVRSMIDRLKTVAFDLPIFGGALRTLEAATHAAVNPAAFVKETMRTVAAAPSQAVKDVVSAVDRSYDLMPPGKHVTPGIPFADELASAKAAGNASEAGGGGFIGGFLRAAAPAAAVLAAIAVAGIAVTGAFSNAKEAVSLFTDGILTVDPSALLAASSSAVKAAGYIGLIIPGLQIFAPALIIAGHALGALQSVMDTLINTLGQYNGAVTGAMAMTDLMGRMLKIQIAGYLQPAMIAWIKLIQDIMGLMSSHPAIWKALNDVLVTVIGWLSKLILNGEKWASVAAAIFKVVWNVIGALATVGKWIIMIMNPILLLTQLLPNVGSGFMTLIQVLGRVILALTHLIPGPAGDNTIKGSLRNAAKALISAGQGADAGSPGNALAANALQFNRGFLMAMGGAAPSVAGGGGLRSQIIADLQAANKFAADHPNNPDAIKLAKDAQALLDRYDKAHPGSATSSPINTPAKIQALAQMNVPKMDLPKFETNVHLNAQMQIMHEASVRDGIERLKQRVFESLKVARDETRLLASMVDGHGVAANV